MKIGNALIAAAAGLAASMSIQAQTMTWTSSTEGNEWKETKVRLQNPSGEAALSVSGDETSRPFRSWGVTFNELDWDALCILSRNEQDEILSNLFSSDGQLRVSRGRISLGANDYARSWYSNDEVEGDFDLKHFTIERDKQAIIPFIRAAQKYNPGLSFWISPWSPPSWMKINGNYAVKSSPYNKLDRKLDYLLFDADNGPMSVAEAKLVESREGRFPEKLTRTDYFIQDPRYLRAYANYFCRFIEEYGKQGIPIDAVIYQNEAYSYTPYPGCPWTVEGTQRFNRDYLAPALREQHPGVKLYLGTWNTNRLDHVEAILSDKELCAAVSGIGIQWEGREILATIREQHPDWEYMCSESECGWGDFSWSAAEHTFELMNHYLGNGCTVYNFWNCILADNGESPWGWKQNALIHVDSQTRTFTYTPEYLAARHYASFLNTGSQVIGYKPEGEDHMPVLIARNPEGKLMVIAGNFSEESAQLKVRLGKKMLDVTLQPHSFNTFSE